MLENHPNKELSVSPPARVRTQTSVVWKFFDQKNEDPPTAVCNLCQEVLKRTSTSTTPLLTHLRRKHPQDLESASPMKKRKRNTTDSPRSSSNQQQNKIDSLILKFITYGFHPLSVVEEHHFVTLIHELTESYQVPSRSTLTSLLRCKYNEKRAKVTFLKLISLIHSIAHQFHKNC
jgi:hypothetical protein